jgi:hypothetical protein
MTGRSCSAISQLGYKLFPNASTGVSRFGYFLFGAGLVGWVLDWTFVGEADFPVQLGYSVMALVGLVTISVAKQLKNLERRLDALEQARDGYSTEKGD